MINPTATSIKPRLENALAIAKPSRIPGMYLRLKNEITQSISLTLSWIAHVPMVLITVKAAYSAAKTAFKAKSLTFIKVFSLVFWTGILRSCILIFDYYFFSVFTSFLTFIESSFDKSNFIITVNKND